VGLLVNRVGDLKPWPFRRVRLTVEDSGCGMPLEQLERLLSGGRAPSRGSHGIGFRVVRELVVASAGDLRIMSAPGVGTRVQIEWPMAAAHPKQVTESPGLCGAGGDRRQSC
jgi:signal transduction histidine kinase